MIKMSLYDLKRIKKICEEVGTEYFELSQPIGSGIGSILTLSYDTEFADCPAKVMVEITSMEKC
jgi:hypothetical protein